MTSIVAPHSIVFSVQAIAYTLKNSIKELGLLVFLLTVSGLIFASFTYFIDGGQASFLSGGFQV